MENLRKPGGGRFAVSPVTEHLFRKSRTGLCADCGMNNDGRGHVLARRRAAGKPPQGWNGPIDKALVDAEWAKHDGEAPCA